MRIILYISCFHGLRKTFWKKNGRENSFLLFVFIVSISSLSKGRGPIAKSSLISTSDNHPSTSYSCRGDKITFLIKLSEYLATCIKNRLFSQKCQLSRKMPIISQFKKKVVEYRTRAEYLEHKLK